MAVARVSLLGAVVLMTSLTIAVGPAQAAITITPPATAVTLHSNVVTFTYTFSFQVVTVDCASTAAFTTAFLSDSVSIAAKDITFSSCNGAFNSQSCSSTATTSGTWGMTADTNLGGGSYHVGLDLGGINFDLSGCFSPTCVVTLGAQTLGGASTSWTNANKPSVTVNASAVSFTSTGCGFVLTTLAMTADYTQTQSTKITITG
jgi:hypothetical protein